MSQVDESGKVVTPLGDESGRLVAIIGDEDTVTGFILAGISITIIIITTIITNIIIGIGHRNVEGQNFLVVKPDTDASQVEEAFKYYTYHYHYYYSDSYSYYY